MSAIAHVEVEAIDHVNIITRDLERLADFYVRILGLRRDFRPNFASTGAWLYAGERPVAHLVLGRPQAQMIAPQLEHFALRGRGLISFLAALDANSIEYRLSIVPDLGLRVVNLPDPDGNRIEMLFQPDEDAPAFARLAEQFRAARVSPDEERIPSLRHKERTI
jgi:catechol 2,3-dioxygenase-like lactoylglutathione lyase family enzyme